MSVISLLNPMKYADTFKGIRNCISDGLVDWPLVVALTTISMLGIVFIFSSSIPFAEENYGDPFYFVINQIKYIFLGVTVAFVMLKVQVREWSVMERCCC